MKRPSEPGPRSPFTSARVLTTPYKARRPAVMRPVSRFRRDNMSEAPPGQCAQVRWAGMK